VTTSQERDFEDAKSIYFHEVIRQASLFAYGIEQIESALDPNPPAERKDGVILAAGITVALAASGVVSKLLWPITRDSWSIRRGRSLRSALAVSDGSALESRDVRDSLEHFDERLDAFSRETYNTFGSFHWLVMSHRHPLGDSNAMPILRYIDPETLIIRLPGRGPAETGRRAVSLDLRSVGQELERVRNNAHEILKGRG
jgi:hypothetical protein